MNTTINPALEALHKLESDNYFTEATDKQKLIDVESWLAGHAAGLLEIVNSGFAMYNKRPQAMIREAFALADNLRKQIEGLKITNSNLLSRHIEKTDALIKQNFTPAEIEKILPPPDQRTKSNTELTATLQDKLDRLWSFATDSPRFDASKISDIDLGGYLETAEYQLSQKTA